jgi:hypothetical protein
MREKDEILDVIPRWRLAGLLVEPMKVAARAGHVRRALEQKSLDNLLRQHGIC